MELQRRALALLDFISSTQPISADVSNLSLVLPLKRKVGSVGSLYDEERVKTFELSLADHDQQTINQSNSMH